MNNNNKELKIGAILSILTIILGALIQIFYTPFYMKHLGASDYGINSLVQSLMSYIGMLNLGLGNAMLRYTVRYRAEGKYEAEKSLNGMFFIIFSIIMIISFVLGIFIYLNIPTLFSNNFNILELEKTKQIFLIMTINIGISFPLSIFSINVTSHEKFLFQKGLELIKILGIPFIGFFLILNGFGIISIAMLTVIFSIIMNLLNIYYSIKLGMKIKFSNIDWKILKEIFNYSFYIFLNIIIDRIYWSTDGIIIGKYIGTKAVAIYSIASIFNMLYISLSTSISGVLFPRINKIIIEENAEQKLTALFIKIGRIQYTLIALISTGFILYGKDFIILWLGKDYLKVYSITLWIMLPLTVPMIQNIGVSILQAKNLHSFRSIIYFFIAILNIVTSVYLVKIYGIIGCAVATGLSFILGQVIIMNIYYMKKINIDILKFWKNILEMSFPVIIIVGFGHLLNYYIRDYSIINFISKVIIYTIIYGILMWLMALKKYEKTEILKFILVQRIIKNYRGDK